jgi:hypothetical protein
MKSKPMPIFSHQGHWMNMQMGYFVQKNHFFYIKPNYLVPQPTQNQEIKVVGHVVGYAMFLAILGLGVVITLCFIGSTGDWKFVTLVVNNISFCK